MSITPEQREEIIRLVQQGEDLSPEWARILFPPEKREYELVYHGKEREQDIRISEDDSFWRRSRRRPEPQKTFFVKPPGSVCCKNWGRRRRNPACAARAPSWFRAGGSRPLPSLREGKPNAVGPSTGEGASRSERPAQTSERRLSSRTRRDRRIETPRATPGASCARLLGFDQPQRS